MGPPNTLAKGCANLARESLRCLRALRPFWTLEFISSAQLFWFLLDTSYGHGCHLASRFSLDPDEFEALLIVAGLVSYTRFGFQIKADAWTKFLGGRQFVINDCPIEFEQKKIDLDAYINGTPPSTKSAAAAHRAAAAARWQQRGGCGGGGSATEQRWRQHGGGTVAAAASAAVAAARSAAAVYSAKAAARLQQRGCFGGGGSTTARCHYLRSGK